MAKIYKLDSEVHKHFENMFDRMRGQGIEMEAYGGNVQFFLDEDTFPNISAGNRHVTLIDEYGEEIVSFPPTELFRVKVFNS